LERIRAQRVVLAMGSWIMPFLDKIGLSIPMIGTEECVAYFMPKPNAPDHTFKSMPVFIPAFEHKIVTELMEAGIEHESANDWGFYGLPQVEIPGVKISAHHTGVPFTDPAMRASQTSPEKSKRRQEQIIAACGELIQHLFPYLDTKPHTTVHCLYTSTPDHDFIVDTHPSDPRLVVAAGFSGHGFKFGPSLGDLIESLVTNGTSTAEDPSTARFSLRRFPKSGLLR